MQNVAVIMSVYFTDKLSDFELSVKSILSQSYDNVYLFLYRDGLVDNETQAFLDSLNVRKRVFVFSSETNAGLANGLNFLIDEVIKCGIFSFIARMDSDDLSRLNRIERQVCFFNSNPMVDVCGTSCKEFGASFALDVKELPKSHDELFDFTITHCPFIHPTVMFRTSIFESGVRYPTNTSFTEDMALWFDLLLKGYIFSNINEVLLDYRLNENTLKRRQGLSKAISEVKLRWIYMNRLNRKSLRSSILILFRFIFHLLPTPILKFLYKKAR
jgi:hypothetical protein